MAPGRESTPPHPVSSATRLVGPLGGSAGTLGTEQSVGIRGRCLSTGPWETFSGRCIAPGRRRARLASSVGQRSRESILRLRRRRRAGRAVGGHRGSRRSPRGRGGARRGRGARRARQATVNTLKGQRRIAPKELPRKSPVLEGSSAARRSSGKVARDSKAAARGRDRSDVGKRHVGRLELRTLAIESRR
jgi:hypothetical protein